MATSHDHRPDADDIDMQALGRAVWRVKGWIFGLAIAAGLATFIGLSMVRPFYRSEARILIQNDESAYTRPTSDQGRDPQQRTLDEQAVQGQVQVLTSRDLAVEVIKSLDLVNNDSFAKDAGTNVLVRFLNRMGLARPSPRSEEEKAANTFAEHLSVFQLAKSSVIAVEYASGDPVLAAEIANKLAGVYIDWQREAKLEQTKDATLWLSAQIDVLRAKVEEAEAAAEQFKSSEGLFSGGNNVTLNAQQLSELNSQLILAKAQRSEAEARARLIKKMLAEKSDIDATSEVLKSELIGRLIDQRVQVQRQLAELSATLLPSHPRVKQLSSELADVRVQIRAEANKIAKSLENEAVVAAARETSLRNSLIEVQTQASGMSEAEVKLRALEHEAKAQRDLLESYLARFRDASARHDMGAVPAQATIVSRAHASIKPSFPKRGPMSLLVAAATALLALAYVLARALIGTPAGPRVSRGSGGGGARRGYRNLRAPRESASEPGAPGALAPLPRVDTKPLGAGAEAVVAAAPVERPTTPAKPASGDQAAASAWQPKRPTFLPSRHAAEPTEPAADDKVKPAPAKGAQSAAGFPARLRRSASPSASEPPPATEPAPGLLARIRRSRAEEHEPAVKPEPAQEPKGANMPVLRTNDLRHYLNQRLAASAAEAANDSTRKEKAPAPKRDERIGPVLKSLDAVVNHVLAAGRGGAPRALLVAGASPKLDATREAIAISRALVDRREQVVLVDLARGPAAISGPLELPRAPGLTDVTAGRSGFEDVVKIDATTPLQIIPAGNPKLAAGGDENERFAPVFEALMQAYDCVVLHADLEAVRKLTPALKFELPVVVAVLPAGASTSNGKAELADLASLGCPVVVYEQEGKQPRSGLFRRKAAG